jgi:hypothetical protein
LTGCVNAWSLPPAPPPSIVLALGQTRLSGVS